MALTHPQIGILLSDYSFLISHLSHCPTPREPAIQPHRNPSGTHPPISIRTYIGLFNHSPSLDLGWVVPYTPAPQISMTPWICGITMLNERSLPLLPFPPQLLPQVQKTLFEEDQNHRTLTHCKSKNSCQQTTATGPWGCQNSLSVMSCWSFPRNPTELELDPLPPQFPNLHPHGPSSRCLFSLRRLQSSCKNTWFTFLLLILFLFPV